MSDTWILIFGIFGLFVNILVYFLILKDRLEDIEVMLIELHGDTYPTKLFTEKIFHEVYALTGKYIREEGKPND